VFFHTVKVCCIWNWYCILRVMFYIGYCFFLIAQLFDMFIVFCGLCMYASRGTTHCNFTCTCVKVHLVTICHTEAPSCAARGSGVRGLWTVISHHLPQLEAEARYRLTRGKTFHCDQPLSADSPAPCQSSITDCLSPLLSNLVTSRIPNKTLKFHERVICWSKLSAVHHS